jgi:hypothetical protein
MWICMEISVDIHLLREDFAQFLRYEISIYAMPGYPPFVVNFRSLDKLHHQRSFRGRYNSKGIVVSGEFIASTSEAAYLGIYRGELGTDSKLWVIRAAFEASCIKFISSGRFSRISRPSHENSKSGKIYLTMRRITSVDTRLVELS